MKGWQVGYRVERVHHWFCSFIFDSISSTSRLHCRLNTWGSWRSTPNRYRGLDIILWWIMGNLRCRCRRYSNFTIKIKTCYAARLEFNCTNNIVEYEDVLLGLRKLRAMGIRREILKSDSQVITGQVGKSSKARDQKLEKYLDIVRRMEASFEGF